MTILHQRERADPPRASGVLTPSWMMLFFAGLHRAQLHALCARRFPSIAGRLAQRAASTAARASADARGGALMTWNDFLKLRMKRRRLGQVCSVGTMFMGTSLAWLYMSNLEIDLTQKMFGIDIIFVYAAGVLFCGMLGYLVGPSIGNVLFRGMLGRRAGAFTARDSEFLHHIARNRPDGSKQSNSNPITDYYGEKIGSLHDYRQWLRDAHLFKRKSETFL